MVFQVIRNVNIGDYVDSVIWEAVLETFTTKNEAEDYIKELIKTKPYLKYDRLYIKEENI